MVEVRSNIKTMQKSKKVYQNSSFGIEMRAFRPTLALRCVPEAYLESRWQHYCCIFEVLGALWCHLVDFECHFGAYWMEQEQEQ